MLKNSQKKKERDKRVCNRIKAVLLPDKDRTQMQIADALLLSEEILRQHLKEFQASRKLKLEDERLSHSLEAYSKPDPEMRDPHSIYLKTLPTSLPFL